MTAKTPMTIETANTEQLIAEILFRCEDDARALRHLQSVVLQAWLAAIDRQAPNVR